MKSSVFCLALSVSLALGLAPRGLPAQERSQAIGALHEYCASCHGQDDTTEGEVNLLELRTEADLLARPELLGRIVKVLHNREMPPEDAESLPSATRRSLVEALQTAQREAAARLPFKSIPIRRMNRFQYNNAVVDLLELDRDIFQLNERLMRRRSDYFHPASGKMPEQVRVSSRPLSKDIDNQRPEGFRGVAAFPQDQRAEHGFDNRADHLTLSPLLMESFLTLSQTITESPDLNRDECRSWHWLFAAPGESRRGPEDGRYEAERRGAVRVVGSPKGQPTRQEMRGRDFTWSGDAHLFWRCPRPDLELSLAFDAPEAATGLNLRLTRARDYGAFQVRLDGDPLGEPIDLHADKISTLEVPLAAAISPGRHRISFQCVGKNAKSKRHFFGLDYFELTGRAGAQPEKVVSLSESLRSRMAKLLRRAFRRPVDDATLARFVAFAEAELEAGVPLPQTMRRIVAAVLAMPDFLYLYEGEAGVEGAPAGRTPITDFELASRLAQFFWSSIPDDALLDLAEAGQLRSPAILAAQIDRLMNDDRAGRFCDNFPSQWLQLDRLVTAIPDRQKYPYFYYNGYRTSMHMMSEPLLLFETIFVENRSLVELLDPGYTWESSMLAANYQGTAQGGRDVQVQTFRRVPIEDPRRGGVVTNAAIMTMTSTPTRTQPITRGAWVNAVIFNDPPEPPPADVPPLPEGNAEELAKLTIRERLAVHRKREDCAGCHNKIDPLGFALENYGPTGVWRDVYENGRDVDASGVLFHQHKFDTVVEFKQLLLAEKERFFRGFLAHLLSYALGRELGPADTVTLADLTERAASGEDSLRDVLKAIAMSEPFLHKNTLPAATAAQGHQE